MDLDMELSLVFPPAINQFLMGDQMEKLTIPRQWLEIAALELNQEMGLEPPIDIDEPDDYLQDCIEYAASFVNVDDAFSLVTWACMGHKTAKFMMFSKEKSKEHDSRSV